MWEKAKIAGLFIYLGWILLLGVGWIFFWATDAKELSTLCLYSFGFFSLVGGFGWELVGNPEKKNRWEIFFEFVVNVFVGLITGWMGYQLIQTADAFAIFGMLGLWIHNSTNSLQKGLRKVAEVVDKKADSAFRNEYDDKLKVGSAKFSYLVTPNYFNILSFYFPSEHEKVFESYHKWTEKKYEHLKDLHWSHPLKDGEPVLWNRKAVAFDEFYDYVSGLKFFFDHRTKSVSTSEGRTVYLEILEKEWFEENKKKFADIPKVTEDATGKLNPFVDNLRIIVGPGYLELPGDEEGVSIPARQLAQFLLDIQVRFHDSWPAHCAIATFPPDLQALLDKHELISAPFDGTEDEDKAQAIAESSDYIDEIIKNAGLNGLTFFGNGNEDGYHRFQHRFYDLLIRVEANPLVNSSEVVGDKVRKPSILDGMYRTKFGQVKKAWPPWNKPYVQKVVKRANAGAGEKQPVAN